MFWLWLNYFHLHTSFAENYLMLNKEENGKDPGGFTFEKKKSMILDLNEISVFAQ